MINNKFGLALLFSVTVTAPFDISLLLLQSPTIRFTQLAIVILSSYLIFIRKKIILHNATFLIFAWWIIDVICVASYSINSKSVGYSLWLFLNLLLLICFQSVLKNKDKIVSFCRLYLRVFQFHSFIGIIQFFGGLIGVGDLLAVKTWWIEGFLARPNGFLYEASFYAAYIQMGFLFCFYLFLNTKRHNPLIPISLLRNTMILCSVAIFLSGSRLGILTTYIATIIISYIYCKSCKSYKDIRCSKRPLSLLIYCQLFFTLLVILVIGSDPMRFLGGTGLLDSSTHSVLIRSQGLIPLFESFKSNPFFGIGLGNLSSLFINPLFKISSFSDYKVEGTSVFLEVLSANGIVGFIFLFSFLCFLCNFNISRHAKTISRFAKGDFVSSDLEFRQILAALSFGLINMLILLQFAQNILRPYLWVHMGILLSIHNFLRLETKTIK